MEMMMMMMRVWMRMLVGRLLNLAKRLLSLLLLRREERRAQKGICNRRTAGLLLLKLELGLGNSLLDLVWR